MNNPEITRRYMAELQASEVPMSQSDAVIISQHQPDAPGVFIDAAQVQQDAYGQQLMHMKAAQEAAALAAVNGPAPAMFNPNISYVEAPTRMGCNADGTQIVIY